MSEIAGIVNYKKDISDDIGFRKMVRLPISSELISGMFLSKNCNMSKKILKDELDNVKCISIEGVKYSIITRTSASCMRRFPCWKRKPRRKRSG